MLRKPPKKTTALRKTLMQAFALGKSDCTIPAVTRSGGAQDRIWRRPDGIAHLAGAMSERNKTGSTANQVKSEQAHLGGLPRFARTITRTMHDINAASPVSLSDALQPTPCLPEPSPIFDCCQLII
jgi:hypothetical protein